MERIGSVFHHGGHREGIDYFKVTGPVAPILWVMRPRRIIEVTAP